LRSSAANTSTLCVLRFLLDRAPLNAYLESSGNLCLAIGGRLRFRLQARGPTMASLPTGLLRCPGAELLSAVACNRGVKVCIQHVKGVGPASTRLLNFECPHCSIAKGPISRCVRWKGQLCIIESQDAIGFWRIRQHDGIVKRTKDPLEFVDERSCKCQHFRGDQRLFHAGKRTYKVQGRSMDPGVGTLFTWDDDVERCKADCLAACLGQPGTSVPPFTTVDQAIVDWGLAPTADTDDDWEDLGNDWDDDHDSNGIDEFGHLMDVLGCMQPEL